MTARQTALITGASAGIGQALAEQFAAGGYDVLLLGRDRDRLTDLSLALAKAHNVSANALIYDLCRPDAVSELMTELAARQMTVDVLVNNAGFGVHGPFLSTDLDRELQLVELQVSTLLRLTKALVPGMVGRKRGGLLNVASVYSFSPVANQAVYGGTKSFLYSFTEALATELSGSGLTITLLFPGSTKTEFRLRAGVKEKKIGGSGMTAAAVAAAGFQAFKAGKRFVVPGPANRLFVLVARHVPMAMVAPLLKMINRFRGVGKVARA